VAAKKCIVEGCNSYAVTSYGPEVQWCFSHLKKYGKDLIKQKKEYEKKNKIVKKKAKIFKAQPSHSNPTLAEDLLAPKKFCLLKEIQIQGESNFSQINEEGTIGPIETLKQMVLAKWLNADVATRKPQDVKDVAKLLRVTEYKLSLWIDSVNVQKMRVEMLDNVMRYDLRYIAYSGYAKLMEQGDSKSIDRYMSLYVDKKKDDDKQDNGMAEWLKEKVDKVDEDVKIDMRDKTTRVLVEDLSVKAIMEQ